MIKKLSGGGSFVPGIGIGLLTAFVLSLAGAAVTAWLLGSEMLAEGGIHWAGGVIQAVASFAGGMVSAAWVRKMRLQVCLITGAAYCLVLMGVTALVYDGVYSGFLAGVILIALGSLAAAFLGNRRKKGFKTKMKKLSFR